MFDIEPKAVAYNANTLNQIFASFQGALIHNCLLGSAKSPQPQVSSNRISPVTVFHPLSKSITRLSFSDFFGLHKFTCWKLPIKITCYILEIAHLVKFLFSGVS